jgi:hypothetical protein
MSGLQECSCRSTIASVGVASKSWQREHVDFAGPFLRKMFLIYCRGCILQVARGRGNDIYGASEGFIQTFKRAMKAGQGTALPLSQRLSNFLLTYRTTPNATTNEKPSQLLMGRKIRTRLDLLKPDGESHVSRLSWSTEG